MSTTSAGKCCEILNLHMPTIVAQTNSITLVSLPGKSYNRIMRYLLDVMPDSYKAALTNPRISEAAKEHAREQLELLEGYSDDQKDDHNNRVLGGGSSFLVRGAADPPSIHGHQASKPR